MKKEIAKESSADYEMIPERHLRYHYYVSLSNLHDVTSLASLISQDDGVVYHTCRSKGSSWLS